MKKFIVLLIMLCSLSAVAQVDFGYTYIGQRYKWLGGLFNAFGLPTGDGPASFATGQHQRSGALYYDSLGIDSGLYVWSGLAWHKVWPSTGGAGTPGEGMTVSGDSIHLGGLFSAPGIFFNDRWINQNRKVMVWTNGTQSEDIGESGAQWDFGQQVYSPYQFLSRDTAVHNVDPPTAGVPWSGIFARRDFVFPVGAWISQKVFGHQFEMRWMWDDTMHLRTEGGDYNAGFSIKDIYKPYGTGRQGIRINGTLSPNQINFAAPALLVVKQLEDTTGNYIKINGHTSGVNSYIVGSAHATDTIKGHVFYTTGAFGNTFFNKIYDFAPTARYAPPTFSDSAFLIWDTTNYKNNHFGGKSVLGPSKGTANTWASTDVLKVLGNLTTTDTVVVGARNTTTDTTGFDLILRRRTTGGLVSIRPDEWFAFNSVASHGLDNTLAIGQALTTDRTTPTSAFLWDINSSSTNRTFGAVNTGTGGVAILANGSGSLGIGLQSIGILYGIYGVSDNVPFRLDNNQGAASNMMELNRAYDAGTAPDGMVGNIFEYSMENTSGSVTPVHVLQTKLDESAVGNETASVQFQVKHNGAFEDYLDMQTGGINRTNNNADTLATRAYARSLISGGGAVWGLISGTLSDQTDLQTALNGKANTTLNNLGSVAVNTTIASDADNTDDLGSSSNSWKDIYTRTVKYDGSTSGTVTVEAQATGISPLVTTTTGQGYGYSCMEAREAVGSDFTGQNINTVQPMFNTGIDVWPLQGSTSYDFEGFISLNHGASSHSVGLSFELSGGATVTSISYMTMCWVTAIGTNTASQTTNFIQVATNTAVNAAGANATEQIFFKGVINMNAAGNVTPSYTFSSAPGGTCVTKGGSYIKFCPKGTNTFTNQGPAN